MVKGETTTPAGEVAGQICKSTSLLCSRGLGYGSGPCLERDLPSHDGGNLIHGSVGIASNRFSRLHRESGQDGRGSGGRSSEGVEEGLPDHRGRHRAGRRVSDMAHCGR
ncbi:unnamed protein product [Urochloa humidicola]